MTETRFILVEVAESKRKYLKEKKWREMPTKDAAVGLNVSTSTVARWRLEFGFTPPKIRIDKELEANILIMVASKEFGLKELQSELSINELAIKFGLKYWAVFKTQTRLGVQPNGQKYRRKIGDFIPLMNDKEDLELVKLATKCYSRRPKGMTQHLESLRD